VPLTASAQRALKAPLRAQAQPIFDALVVLATNAPVLHHENTTMRILDLQRPGSATVDELARPMSHRKARSPRTCWPMWSRIRSPDT
jgi:hypothetical protein